MMPVDNLVEYYARRAAEYERIYAKPERQADLAVLRARIGKSFTGRRVLELACGTGYWTEVIAGGAEQLTALDANEEVLEIARAKHYPANRVELLRGDCYAPPDFNRRHDALFAGFWWSHVPLEKLDPFLRAVNAALAPGSLIAFLDNRYVEGSSTPVARRDARGNAYQLRKLDDGSTHEVLKNFPTPEQAIAALGPRARDAQWIAHTHYWVLKYSLV